MDQRHLEPLSLHLPTQKTCTWVPLREGEKPSRLSPAQLSFVTLLWGESCDDFGKESWRIVELPSPDPFRGKK